jgi:long-chain acyl-CoA synthetase
VVTKRGQTVSADEIKQFALANAPAYAHPRFVWFIDNLPLASTNKVDRPVLQRMAEQRSRNAQDVNSRATRSSQI